MRTGVVLLLLFSASLAFGKVYQWVDESEVRHFSDQPSPDEQATRTRYSGALSDYSVPRVPRVALEPDAAQLSSQSARSPIRIGRVACAIAGQADK